MIRQFLKRLYCIKFEWNLNKLINEYKDKAIDYFKFKDVRNNLSIGNKYFLLIEDEENHLRNEPLFFILKEKTRDGIIVNSYASFSLLSPGSDKIIFEGDFTDPVEELFIANDSLDFIRPMSKPYF